MAIVVNNSDGPYNAFHPVLDGAILRTRPTPAILSGQFARVPLIVGYVLSSTLPL